MSDSELEPAERVTEGLSTISDRIRALAKAGYLRTDIAKHLGIRHQHVRNVLYRSGIESGLKRVVAVELEPVDIEIEVSEEAPPPASWRLLLDGGFVHASDWTLAGGDGIELSVKAPDEPGVYAFVIDETIMYVGITQRTLHQRMYGYKRGYARHRTSFRVKQLILSTLKRGEPVKVLIATPKEKRDWNGLPVDTSAGLEIGLIRLIQPEWNMLGVKTQPKTTGKQAS